MSDIVIILVVFVLVVALIAGLGIYFIDKHRQRRNKLASLTPSLVSLNINDTNISPSLQPITPPYRPLTPGYVDYGIPPGSWVSTCRSATINDNVLTAQCRGLDGQYHPTTLDLKLCNPGDVGNNNGRLTCHPGRGLCAAK